MGFNFDTPWKILKDMEESCSKDKSIEPKDS